MSGSCDMNLASSLYITTGFVGMIICSIAIGAAETPQGMKMAKRGWIAVGLWMSPVLFKGFIWAVLS